MLGVKNKWHKSCLEVTIHWEDRGKKNHCSCVIKAIQYKLVPSLF